MSEREWYWVGVRRVGWVVCGEGGWGGWWGGGVVERGRKRVGGLG